MVANFNLKQFMSEVNQCDLIVTAVTMAMHITIGLGEILEPEFDCNCYFSPTCKNNCMQYIHVDRVFNTIQNLLNK
ncbi:MAG: hypothetical protein QME25_02525 [Bacteroidota bacterium]|nr:hypothetical protein [Bacteroidota bacterium]